MRNRNKNIGINAILNVIKYSLAVIFPLITYPYAIRTLGAEGIGKVSFSNSILTYFSLLAMLGVSTYGVREGAKLREDKIKFNSFANELFTINIISTCISYALLISAVFIFNKLHAYAGLIALQSASIILTTLGVDWINTVYEDFLYVTVRSIVAHIICLVLLFVMVHDPSDYYYYALLTISTNGITCISNWFYCRKYVNIRLTKKPNFRTHLRPLLFLFVNALTVSIYVNIDTTMLGWLKGDYSVGVYTVSVKVYTIIKNILIAIYAVCIPRLATYIGKNQMEEYKSLLTDVWNYVTIILLPAGVGLLCVAGDVMTIMGGEELSTYKLSLQILAISLIFAIFGGLVTAVINITLSREKENMVASFIGAALNLILNFFFIPRFSLYGAAFTTMLSECFVFLYCFIRIPHKQCYLDFTKTNRTLVHAVIGSILMALFAYGIERFVHLGIAKIFITVFSCIMVYALILLVLRDTYFLNIINIARLRIKKLKHHNSI